MDLPAPPPLQRLRLVHWVAIDLVVSVLLGLVALQDWGMLSVVHEHGIQGAAPIAVLGTLVAGLRRLRPRAVLAGVTAVWALATALGHYPGVAVPVAFAMYLIPLRLPMRDARRWLAGTAVAIVVAPLVHLVAERAGPAPGVAVVLRDLALAGFGWAVGFAVWQQRAYAAVRREQVERESREEIAQFRRTVSEERLTIARELHDVLAHSMGLIAVQAGVANYLVAQRPDEAARALASIEEISRGALGEMRGLLGALRSWEHSDDRERDLLPVPRLANLAGLVERAGAAGVRVTLDVRGRERPLPAGLELAVYRVAQEAVTNVIRHASTDACQMTVSYSDAAVELDVTDAGRGAGSGWHGRFGAGGVVGREDGGAEPEGEQGEQDGRGSGDSHSHGGVRRSEAGSGEGRGGAIGHGIVGMRERAAMYGGQLRAEPRPDGGFRVNAMFLLGGADG
jgi:signal transduction histidine kinase